MKWCQKIFIFDISTGQYDPPSIQNDIFCLMIPPQLPCCGVTVAEEEVTVCALWETVKVMWGVKWASLVLQDLLCFFGVGMFSCLVFLMFLLRLENYLKIPLQVVYTENIHYTLTSKLVLPASSFENIFTDIPHRLYIFVQQVRYSWKH